MTPCARACAAQRGVDAEGFVRAVDVYISGVIESPWLTSYDQERCFVAIGR